MHFGDLARDPTMTAALLIADATIPHDDHGILPEIAWGALDCPSYVPALWTHDSPSLLAWMHAELLEPIPLGEPIVACGWPLESEGRKQHTASALLTAATGGCSPAPATCGCARARSRAEPRPTVAPARLAGSAWIAIHSAAPDDLEQPRDVAVGAADDREAAAVRADLRGGAEQRAQPGRVAEVDVREVDQQSRQPAGARRVEPRAQPRRRRDVELTAHGDDAWTPALLVLVDRERSTNASSPSTLSGCSQRQPLRPAGRAGRHPARARCFFGFFGFGFGQDDADAARPTPSGPLGPCASIRSPKRPREGGVQSSLWVP